MQRNNKILKIYLRRFVLMSLALSLFLPVREVYAIGVLFCELNSVLYSCTDECSSTSSVTSSKPSSVNSGGDGGSCGNDANGDQANKDQVWGFLVNKFTQSGYTKDEAEKASAGIMGNWLQESAFNSYRSDGSGCNGASGPVTGSAGMGIAQWCGSRQQDLSDFATERGKDWTCLGAQLEFTWQEMEERDLVAQMKGLSPSQSSQIFDEKFEVSDGSGERQKKGEQMYTVYTGKEPGSLSASSNTSSSCSGGNTGGVAGAVPGATCAEAQPAALEAIASGKLNVGDGEHKNDIENCSDEPITRCTEGIRGTTLRGLMAGANSSGTESITVTDIHRNESCNYGDHPEGLATDIGAVNGEACLTDSPACDALFQYYVDNAEELGIRWIIYDGPGCKSTVAGNENISECRGDHSNHIHVSYKE